MGSMTRRDWLQATAIGAVALGVEGCSQQAPPSPAQSTAAPDLRGTPFQLKLCVEGLSVLHRDRTGGKINYIRLGALNASHNSQLMLHPHAAILRIPRGILKAWTLPASSVGHDYVEWSV